MAEQASEARLTAAPAAASAWDRYWFGEASLVRLAAFRIVLLCAALYAVFQFRPGVLQHADGRDVGYRSWDPIYLFDALRLAPPGPLAARVVLVALLVGIAAGIAGLFTRTACALVAALLVLWAGTSYSFGKPHHDLTVLVFGLCALPFAPVGARLSVDSLRARLRRARRGEDPLTVPTSAPLAALPLRLTQVSAALGYFFSGASKLAIGGPGWANGYTLQGIMLEFEAPWTELFVHDLRLLRLMSVGLLFVQASFPLVFLAERLRWFYVPLGVLFHLLAWKTMDTGPFLTLWFTLAAFVHLERVPGFLGARLRGGRPAARMAWGAATLGASGLVLSIYFAMVPAWLALFLVPPAAAALRALAGAGRRVLTYDPTGRADLRRVALRAAFDWSASTSFVPRPSAGSP